MSKWFIITECFSETKMLDMSVQLKYNSYKFYYIHWYYFVFFYAVSKYK